MWLALFLAGGVRSRCKEIFGPFSAQPIFTTSKVFFCFPTLPPTFFFLPSSPFPFWRSNWKWALFLVSFPPSLFCEWVKEATGPGKTTVHKPASPPFTYDTTVVRRGP